MAAQTGHVTPGNKIIDFGKPQVIIEKSVETVANVYPGRLVALGTTDYDIKVADGVLARPIAWALYEQTTEEYRKDAYTTIYTVLDKINVGRGGDFCIYAWMPRYFYATQGDPMLSWAAGYVVPGELIGGQPFVKIPYTKKNGESDTGVDLVAGMVVSEVKVQVDSVGSTYIDVGLLSSESGGNADGFLDGTVTTALGLVSELITLTNGTNNHYIAAETDVTRGELLMMQLASHTKADFVGADAADHEDGSVYKRDYTVAAAVSVVYNTNNVATSGYILIGMKNPGIQVVGIAEETVDSASAEKRIWVRNKL